MRTTFGPAGQGRWPPDRPAGTAAAPAWSPRSATAPRRSASGRTPAGHSRRHAPSSVSSSGRSDTPGTHPPARTGTRPARSTTRRRRVPQAADPTRRSQGTDVPAVNHFTPQEPNHGVSLTWYNTDFSRLRGNAHRSHRRQDSVVGQPLGEPETRIVRGVSAPSGSLDRYVTHNQLDYLTNRYDANRRLLCQLAGRTGAELDGVRSTGGLEAVEDQPYCHGALADRGRGTLDRAAADVADGEDSRPAGLEEQRSRGLAVESGRRNVGAGEQEPVAVFGELASQPAGPGFGADKDEQPSDGELGLATLACAADPQAL